MGTDSLLSKVCCFNVIILISIFMVDFFSYKLQYLPILLKDIDC